MKNFKAFIQLIRLPNLIFIAITQIIFLYCIEMPLFNEASVINNVRGIYFVALVTASVFIAAAGNIINDYFDLNIDQINKPHKVVVEKIIKRRWVILWHILLSLTGIVLGFYVDASTPVRFLGIANSACVVLLFFYSASLKKKFLIGNILISLLTSWVILVITYCETNHLFDVFRKDSSLQVDKLSRLTFLYAGFAFIISLIREVIKDMEDMEGDRKFGCKTLPIVLGLNATKVFVAVWLIVLIAALVIIQFYVLQFGWVFWLSALYCVLFIITPLIWILLKLFKAHTAQEFHKLSSVVKIVMFTGILSMLFFRLYA
ncbi:MAG TPA: geranylgeranylglycerol-phosphate geranylgeranyltransferase [Chitinophagaceae bacterium]|nr:geranylgeranylglycerol-phosphate geranylgeranyltransferase [Chitinophagaceae bacterium]HMZ46688.1 geranylgeranylglycerol-phosphate geranylgeranyltransferase [Chitinophagaceae bacterium]HNE92694.1 geranylgeranylglycerol-phosphate geranylgeranyltransferase [Chitinophagaceae bacterium]HNF29078.1 geranylgeranylglycerol-phosphate geranylgeranyltransferase [Chitinophagaceae bacterium]HNJ58713.1 geranylgeranylglycerol-phosphate geranylgeranyltransferase [Chitinophagaceae bacterium]